MMLFVSQPILIRISILFDLASAGHFAPGLNHTSVFWPPGKTNAQSDTEHQCPVTIFFVTNPDFRATRVRWRGYVRGAVSDFEWNSRGDKFLADLRHLNGVC
jgi:hypothetical protein